MGTLITPREAQALAKIGATAFYMAKRFNPNEFPKEHIISRGERNLTTTLYNKDDVINFFLIKYPNFSE